MSQSTRQSARKTGTRDAEPEQGKAILLPRPNHHSLLWFSMSEQSPLFSPYAFRSGAVARNRITLAPLTNGQSGEDGVCSADELRWLERRAQSGYAIVMTCASHVSAAGKGFQGQLGCFSDVHIPGLRQASSMIASYGALSMIQLYHGGARSPSRLTGVQPMSASAWMETTPGFDDPRAATEVEIEQVIEDFCAAAQRARRAGFDGVELHGAHGYLFSQFLSSVRNMRTDRWGGSIGGRARLLLTVARRVRAENPPPFTVGVRLSPESMPSAPGLDLDESVQVAQWLAEEGVDFIDLSLWKYTRMTAKRPNEHALPIFRAALPKEVAIFAAGAIWTPADASAVLSMGADFVSLGRAAIVQPDWPSLAREPAFEPRRPPLTPAQYRELDVSEPYLEYLRSFKAMVTD